MNNLLNLQPIKIFIKETGGGIQRYFGEDKACIIYLRPDGAFYGVALYEWLKRKKKNLTLTTMADDGEGLEEKKVKGCRVLIIDNDIITGKGYKRAMEALRMLKKQLDIKDIKFAVFSDRVGVADFSVSTYSADAIWRLDELDGLDLKIIKFLTQNGRDSLAEIGKRINLSAVSVKNRVDKLTQAKIFKVQGVLNIDRFYAISAQIQIEANAKTIAQLGESLTKLQEVYHMVRVSGRYNLVIGIFAHNLGNIEEFIENEIRSLPGVKQIDVHIGELPVIPKTFLYQL